MPNPVRMQAVGLSDVFGLIDQREVPVGTQQRNLLGDRGRHPRRHEFACHVNGIGGHHAIRRVLATGNGHEPRSGDRHGVLAGELGRVIILTGQQRPQSRVDTIDIVVRQRCCQHRVHLVQDVVDIDFGGCRVRQVEIPFGVGGPDDPVVTPRDDEQHRLFGPQDDRHLADDSVPWHHDVHTLGGRNPEPATGARQRLNLIGPHPGGIDDDMPAHLGFGAVLGVPHHHTGDAITLTQQRDHLSGCPDHRPVMCRRPGHIHGVPSVVDHGVVVADTADERVALQSRRQPQRAGAGEMLLGGNRFRAAHLVVQENPGGNVRTFPPPIGQREQERQRLDQMRRQCRER